MTATSTVHCCSLGHECIWTWMYLGKKEGRNDACRPRIPITPVSPAFFNAAHLRSIFYFLRCLDWSEVKIYIGEEKKSGSGLLSPLGENISRHPHRTKLNHYARWIPKKEKRMALLRPHSCTLKVMWTIVLDLILPFTKVLGPCKGNCQGVCADLT